MASKKTKRIYLDYASATPIDPRVSKHYSSILSTTFANPQALHEEGLISKKILEEARADIASLITAKKEEIFFTSGGTESNNLAILGLYEGVKNIYKENGTTPHIITTRLEHKSVLEPIMELEKRGVEVSYLNPHKEGVIDLDELSKLIRPETFLVSIMYVNNEIGTINPIKEISRVIRRYKGGSNFPYFHTDACQAMNYLESKVSTLGVDLMTLNSPKVYAPSGIGALYVRKNIPLNNIIFGGGQEKGMRSGRENPALASAFAYALNLSLKEREKEIKRLENLKSYFVEKVIKNFKGAISMGGNTVPNIINLCFPNLDSEYAVIQLDKMGIAVSSASSCMNTNEDSYSYVIKEIGAEECYKSTLRFSFGRFTKKSDLDYCLQALSHILLIQNSTSKIKV